MRSVLVYDPITDSWSAAADEPTPRANPAAAVVDDKLFVAGGNTDSTPGTSTAEVFTPALCGCVGQLLNISTRLGVQSGDNALIGSFIVTGVESKMVVVRVNSFVIFY
jgi:N-acetylneuraminic acid mutarotase